MQTTPRQSVFERHPRLTIFVVVAVLFAAIDVAAGSLFSRQRRAFEENERAIRRATPYHHGLRANVVVDGMAWGSLRYRMATNSLGFKDAAPREVPLAPDGERIVFIGDSFTEGIGYPHEQTFVGRIEDAMRERGVEVLNAGVIGYSPLIYESKTRYLLEELGLDFDELVVFIDISDAHDDARIYVTEADGLIRHSPEHKEAQLDEGSVTDRIRRFLSERTFLTYAVLNAVHDALRPPEREEIGRYRAAWTFDEAAFDAYGKEGLEIMTGHMDELATLLMEHGVRLTVVVYPWPDQIQVGDTNSIQVSHWRDWAVEHGAGFLSLFPLFIDGRPWEDVVDHYFIPGGDVHFNERGHAAIADAFLDHYETRTTREAS